MRLLIEANQTCLKQTAELLIQLTDAELRAEDEPGTGIGAHVRHLLEHYTCLLEGLPGGEVDYDARRRDPELQASRARGLAVIAATSKGLAALAEFDGERTLRVTDRPVPGEPKRSAASSLSRELLFVLNHAVHHQALVRDRLARLRDRDDCPDEFGVAPSTLHHRET